jgi:hypothetical protein
MKPAHPRQSEKHEFFLPECLSGYAANKAVPKLGPHGHRDHLRIKNGGSENWRDEKTWQAKIH